MPSGGAGRHWKPTKSAGNDAPKCACADGSTAMRSIATVPLCRHHANMCKQALGEAPTSGQVRAWAQQQAGGRAAVPPEPAPASVGGAAE